MAILFGHYKLGRCEMRGRAPSTEIEKIVEAVGLLREVFIELLRLATTNTRLHFAMRDKRFAIGQRLDMLTGVAELLKSAATPLHIRALERRAKALIVELAEELEQLARIVDKEFEWIDATVAFE